MIRRNAAGIPFTVRGHQLRQVNRAHADHYDQLMGSGLYDRLTDTGAMVSHVERGLKFALTDDAYRVIQSKPVPVVSYPYEWSFGQWQAAALHTLNVAETALEAGMTLTNASVYSVQFLDGAPIWTDALAFSSYTEGEPWHAYPQFIRQYLAPLALMATVDVTLGRLLLLHPDGLPTALTSALLPARTRINFGLANHIHLNTRAATMKPTEQRDVLRLLDDLRETVSGLNWTPENSAPAIEVNTAPQRRTLRDYFGMIDTNRVWDLYAGTGTYSHLAADEYGATVAAFNPTLAATEHLWQSLQGTDSVSAILPLTVDWTNPSPGTGWANRERRSIASRGAPDVLLAMDWVHRLALTENIALPAIAAALAQLAPHLIVEFAPRNDPQVIALLERGSDAHDDYTQQAFKSAFEEYYNIVRGDDMPDSPRQLYLLRARP